MVASRPPAARQLRRRLDPLVTRAARTPGANRYRKRFPALAHLWILLLHVLWGHGSLRCTHALLSSDRRWWQRWGMDGLISLSQLARSSTSRPSACVEVLLDEVLAAVRAQAQHDSVARTLQRVAALDSTFVGLSATLCPWSVHGGFAPGVRLQGLLELDHAIPDRLRLTLADVNDHQALLDRDLTPWQGWTLLFDLGYYGHRSFERLRQAGVDFVTRLQPQATYRITMFHPAPSEPTLDGDVILADATITLGSANNRSGAVLSGLRLVISRNRRGEEQQFVTSRYNLTAAQVVQLYRKRWQIELFFRWLKQQLTLTRPLGHSRAAVWLTVLLVVIVTLLSLLLAAQPAGVSRVAWLSQVAVLLLLGTIDDS